MAQGQGGDVLALDLGRTLELGQVNAMLWMAEYPERMGAVINRLGAFYLAMAQAELAAGRGLLDGFVIWGDVAHKKGTFMSPAYWRQYFKPWLAQIVRAVHDAGLPVMIDPSGTVALLM